MSRVVFLRSGLILAVSKDAGLRPEVRDDEGGEEWQDVFREELEEGGGDRFTLGEKGIKWVKTEVGIGRIVAGVKEDLMSFPFLVK